MCVGLPAKVMTMKDGMAVVDASGAKREVSAELIENLEPGDYVMVHAGIAIAKITESCEMQILRLMRMRQKIFWRGYYERTIKKSKSNY